MLGILEFGWLVRNNLIASNAAREGARIASLGRPTADILTRTRNAGKIIGLTNDNIVLTRSADNGTNFTAFPADNTAKDPDQNGVPGGEMVAVNVNTVNKSLVVSYLNKVPIRSRVVMVRENP
jgi:Flp pilus assembly protein TadG